MCESGPTFPSKLRPADLIAILIYAKHDGPWILIKVVLILILSRYWFDPIILIG